MRRPLAWLTDVLHSEERSAADGFAEVLDSEAKRRNVSTDQIVAELREVFDRQLSAQGKVGESNSGDCPGAECLSANELTDFANGGRLSDARQAHVKSCTLCQKLVERAKLDKDAVMAMATRLATPPELSDRAKVLEAARRERRQLREQQEAMLGNEGKRPPRTTPMPSTVVGMIARISLIPAMLLIAFGCYPSLITEPLAAWRHRGEWQLASTFRQDLESVQFLAATTEVDVHATGHIERFTPRWTGSGPRPGVNVVDSRLFVLKLISGDQHRDFPLIDHKGRFADELVKYASSQKPVNIWGQLELKRGFAPDIVLQEMESCDKRSRNRVEELSTALQEQPSVTVKSSQVGRQKSTQQLETTKDALGRSNDGDVVSWAQRFMNRNARDSAKSATSNLAVARELVNYEMAMKLYHEATDPSATNQPQKLQAFNKAVAHFTRSVRSKTASGQGGPGASGVAHISNPRNDSGPTTTGEVNAKPAEGPLPADTALPIESDAPSSISGERASDVPCMLLSFDLGAHSLVATLFDRKAHSFKIANDVKTAINGQISTIRTSETFKNGGIPAVLSIEENEQKLPEVKELKFLMQLENPSTKAQ